MPIRWTAHTPQALQRHGGNLRPLNEAGSDEAMIKLLQAIRSPAIRADEIAAIPDAQPSSP